MTSIPFILHQSWKSKTDIPDRFKFWRDSFLELNPGIDYRFYDDNDNRALLAEFHPQLIPLYDSFPREIFRVDFMRPVYLFHFGGYYADLDFQCLRKLADIAIADIVLGKMGTDDSMPHCIPNALIASAPRQGFWLRYLDAIERTWNDNREVQNVWEHPEFVTGPVVLRNAVLRYQNNKQAFIEETRAFALDRLGVAPGSIRFGELAVLSSHILYPINWKDRIHRRFLSEVEEKNMLHSAEEARLLFPGSVAVTWWAHSWRAGASTPHPSEKQKARGFPG
jgi:hypothetical protein